MATLAWPWPLLLPGGMATLAWPWACSCRVAWPRSRGHGLAPPGCHAPGRLGKSAFETALRSSEKLFTSARSAAVYPPLLSTSEPSAVQRPDSWYVFRFRAPGLTPRALSRSTLSIGGWLEAGRLGREERLVQRGALWIRCVLFLWEGKANDREECGFAAQILFLGQIRSLPGTGLNDEKTKLFTCF